MTTGFCFLPIVLAVFLIAGSSCGSSKALQDNELKSWREAQSARNRESVGVSVNEDGGAAAPTKRRKLPSPAAAGSSAQAKDNKRISQKSATLPPAHVSLSVERDTTRYLNHDAPLAQPKPLERNIKKPVAVQDINPDYIRQETIAPLAFPQPPDRPAEGVRTVAETADEDTAQIINAEMWNDIFPNRYGVARKGKNSADETGGIDFFSYEAFAAACKHYPEFLHIGSVQERRRELAAFLAHIYTETGGLRYVEQLNPKHDYALQHHRYPPTEGMTYHGRGPIQLSYNYNYGQFSADYFGDVNILLQRPEMLADDSVASFASAIWFWMTPQSPKPSCHSVITGLWQPSQRDIDANRKAGFGLTLNIINASQCGSGTAAAALRRYDTYSRLCRYFDVTEGDNCDCINQQPYGK